MMNNSFENLRVCLLSVLILAAVQVVIIFITNYTHLLIPIDLSKVSFIASCCFVGLAIRAIIILKTLER